MARLVLYRAGGGKRPCLAVVRRKSLILERRDYRALHRPAHLRPCDRGTGVQYGVPVDAEYLVSAFYVHPIRHCVFQLGKRLVVGVPDYISH